jgi:competence protein ComFB
MAGTTAVLYNKRRGEGMGFQDKYDFSLLVNEKEHYVAEELEAQLKVRTEVCRCQECVLDMVALALNHVKPVYRVTLLGAIYAQAEDEAIRQEIVEAVQGAIEKISANPSHARD